MGIQSERFTEDCPFCLRPVIFRKQSDYMEHLSECPLRDSQQEIPALVQAKKETPRGTLMTRVCRKILGLNRPNVRANSNKFADEWNRNDEYWRGCMIVCPECYRFEYPADERLHLCSCGSMMGWARELVEHDHRFNFAKEFCAGD